MKTTLNKIRDCDPCTEGWEKLLRSLGKIKADDEPLSITTILDSNGLDDALWCLQTVCGYDREIRLYTVECARSVQYLMTDKRSLRALDVAERYANGLASSDDLLEVYEAARLASFSFIDEGPVPLAEASVVAKSVALELAYDAARTSVFRASDAWGWEAADAEPDGHQRDKVYDKARAKADEMYSDLLRFVCAEIEQRDDLWW